MKKWMKKFKNERGLTLVELLAVIVILAIVAIIAFVFIGGVIENSKKDAHISNAQQIISAAKLYEATTGELPDNAKELQDTRHLEEKILDPWTKTEYDLSGVRITKSSSGGYTIHDFEGDKCTIDGKTEADLSSQDRDTICSESTGS